MTDMHADEDSELRMNSGVFFIKYNDKWQGECYLTEDLTFTSQRSQAAKFYLLGISSKNIITNGNIVTINCNNKILSVNSNGVQLVNRTDITDSIQNFRITTGYENNENNEHNHDVISYNIPVSFILDTNKHLALKYDNNIDLSTHRSRANLHRLSIGDCSDSINSYMFTFERSDSPMLTLHVNHDSVSSDYKNIILLCSLLILLLTCVIISTKIK